MEGQQRRAEARAAEREALRLAEVNQLAGGVEHPLLPYQRDGMLHLAFSERALLADDMGLGKTVQAIAACALLAPEARHRAGSGGGAGLAQGAVAGADRALHRRFRRRSSRAIGRHAAVSTERPSFFNLANYEQVIPDGAEINRLLQPDVVILDEAQRIKNWQTKTARAVKGLRSPYAFVLTGTPLQNRIDELYSIVQFVDPELFGPLFRFNRAFYELDERGRPVGYRNLEEMHRRLEPVMLRRRKSDVEDQLPDRTVRNHVVAMDPEQRLRYQDYETLGGATAGGRPAAQPDPRGVRPAAAVAGLHAHALRHALHSRSRLPGLPQAGGAGKRARGSGRRAGLQDHHLLGMGPHAGAGRRAGAGDGS